MPEVVQKYNYIIIKQVKTLQKWWHKSEVEKKTLKIIWNEEKDLYQK